MPKKWRDVLNPQKAEVDESMPDYSNVPALLALTAKWRGKIRSVQPKSPSKYIAITLDYCELCTKLMGIKAKSLSVCATRVFQ